MYLRALTQAAFLAIATFFTHGHLLAQGYWEHSGTANLRGSIGSPGARRGHSGVWNGEHIILWGGRDSLPTQTTNRPKGGGIYDVSSDQWLNKPNFNAGVGAPSGRMAPLAAWTGTYLFVFGGVGLITDPSYHSGGLYDPVTDTWQIRTVLNAPLAPVAPIAQQVNNAALVAATEQGVLAWGGTELIVGGAGLHSDRGLYRGALYDPLTDQWSQPSGLGTDVPHPRFCHAEVWTGTQFIARGGMAHINNSLPTVDNSTFSAGGIYDLSLQTWLTRPVFGSSVPSRARRYHSAIWTGEWYIDLFGEEGTWSGNDPPAPAIVHNSGLMYDPSADQWMSRPSLESSQLAPQARLGVKAIWTGAVVLAWAGMGDRNADFGTLNTGGLYDPIADTWIQDPALTSNTNAPVGRGLHVTVWTGDRMIVHGGINQPVTSQPIQSWPTDGGVYVPPRVAPTVRNLDPGDQGSASNPFVLQVGERLKHRIVCYGCPEAIVVPQNLPSWLTVGFGGPTNLVSAGTGLGNGGQNGNPPGIGQPFNPWFSAIGGTCDGQWIHGTPSALDVGSYAIQLHAHNGVAPDSATYTLHITVEAPPGTPNFFSNPPLNAEAAEPYSYFPIIPGTVTPTVALHTGPAWLTWNNSTRKLEGTPPLSASDTVEPIVLTATVPGPNGPLVGAQSWQLYIDWNRNDINRDKAIDVTDVQKIVNIVLAIDGPAYPMQGDANRNSVVNVVDVQQVVNKILNP